MTPPSDTPAPSADRNGHTTRSSDSSVYDEVCTRCGGTDARNDDRLEKPCPGHPVGRLAPTPTAAPDVEALGALMMLAGRANAWAAAFPSELSNQSLVEKEVGCIRAAFEAMAKRVTELEGRLELRVLAGEDGGRELIPDGLPDGIEIRDDLLRQQDTKMNALRTRVEDAEHMLGIVTADYANEKARAEKAEAALSELERGNKAAWNSEEKRRLQVQETEYLLKETKSLLSKYGETGAHDWWAVAVAAQRDHADARALVQKLSVERDGAISRATAAEAALSVVEKERDAIQAAFFAFNTAEVTEPERKKMLWDIKELTRRAEAAEAALSDAIERCVQYDKDKSELNGALSETAQTALALGGQLREQLKECRDKTLEEAAALALSIKDECNSDHGKATASWVHTCILALKEKHSG